MISKQLHLGLAVVLVFMSGCMGENGTPSKAASDLEVVSVSEKIVDGAPYNIDLSRDDVVFYLAPDLDVTRLTVTCPAGPTFSFANYIELRVRPTGAKYDSATNELFLANGAIPEYSLRSVGKTFAAAPVESVCSCRDDASGAEYCSGCGAQ